MAEIAPPIHPHHYPERHIHCLLAVEPIFASISDAAEPVGWSRKEVAVALVQLAGANLERTLTLIEEDVALKAAKAVEDLRSKLT